MPRPKTSGRDRTTHDRKPRKAAAGATAEGDAAASSPAASSRAPTPSDVAPAEITVESLIRDLGEVLKIAVKIGRPTAAVAAAVAIARLLHALPDKHGRPPSRHKPSSSLPPPAKFDGNYHDAARRVAFLLGLGKEQKAEAPQEADEANGQKRERNS
jgi:hypothetical protein